MTHRIKRGSQVVINQGEHAGVMGWVNHIEVEHTKETVYPIVWLSIELSRPYGVDIFVPSGMVDLFIKQQPQPLKKAA